jgi:pimeloyl-ACP methyl ester carboxylesterase
MKRKPRLVFIIVAVILCLVLVVAFLLGRDGRGVASYLVWKRLNPTSRTGQYAEVNGIRLYYEIHGRGEPLLLMHGGLGFSDSLYGLIPPLSKHYMVIAPDSRGQGRSGDGAGPLTYDAMIDDMAALLEKLGISKAYVAGWSDGGIIAIGLAVKYPRLVRAIAPIGANVRPDGLEPASIEEIRRASPDSGDQMAVRLAYKLIAPVPAHWPELFRKVNQMWLTQPNFSDDDLRRITCPALVMAGQRDEILDAHTRLIASLIPGSRLVIVPGTSHELPMEKPGVVVDAIVDFCR